jgi:hypothetical protein
MVSIDLAPLVPEARPIVAAAADVFMRHTQPWFIGLVLHGSALKGGVIPGCSDIDFQLYLEDGAFAAGQLRLDTALAIQRDLSPINVAPFQYIQGWARPGHAGNSEKGAIGPIPGTYHLLAGTLPIPEATLEDSLRRAREALDANHAYLGNDLLHHGGGRLERTTRYVCTDVWPVLFSLLVLRERDLSVWRLTKQEAIARLPEPVRSAAQEFLRRVLAHYAGAQDVSTALALIEQGVRTIDLAREAAPVGD